MRPRRELRPALARLDGIDTLRGLSILAVVLLHIWIRFAGAGLRMGRTWPPTLSHLVWFNGGNGVTVFFAVSGFLITLTSLRRFGSLGNLWPLVFYRIRFARIMPLLLLLLVVLSVFHLARVDGFVVNAKFFSLPRALLSALTFHLNWLEASRNAWLPACWTVLWSLSIEEMFYLFFPLACVAMMRRPPIGTALWIALAAALIAMGPFARVVWNHTELQQENSYLSGMSHIAMGCLAAVATQVCTRYRLGRHTELLRLAKVTGWTLIALVAFWPSWRWIRPALQTLGRSGTDDTLLALGACLVMISVALHGAPGKRWTAPLRWFGRHSYEVYLSHEFVVIAGASLFVRLYPKHAGTSAFVPRPVLAGFVVAIVALTAPLGWALARWFSEPLNRKLRGAPLPSELPSPVATPHRL